MPTKQDIDELTAEYPGLMLVYAPTGVAWRWAGTARIRTKRGERVRVEAWRARCRACGAEFEVLAKLPRRLARAYLARTWAGPVSEHRLLVPRGLRIRSFELRNCPEHRGVGNLV